MAMARLANRRLRGPPPHLLKWRNGSCSSRSSFGGTSLLFRALPPRLDEVARLRIDIQFYSRAVLVDCPDFVRIPLAFDLVDVVVTVRS
jgi:hypothetical protein